MLPHPGEGPASPLGRSRTATSQLRRVPVGAPTQAAGQLFPALPRKGIWKPLCSKGPVWCWLLFRGWGSLAFGTCQGPSGAGPGELGPGCSEGRGRIGSDPSDQNCGVRLLPAPACGAAHGRALAGPPTMDWSPDRAHSRNAFNIFF